MAQASLLDEAVRQLDATPVDMETLRVRDDCVAPTSRLMDCIGLVNTKRRFIERELLVSAYGTARAINRRMRKAPDNRE